MKSPLELSRRWAKQWQQPSVRVERLLCAEPWPVALAIGTPSAKFLAENVSAVLRHVQLWQEVSAGEVLWESINYRAGAEPIRLPVRWRLHSPSQWVAAAADASVTREYQLLEHVIAQVDELFRPLLIRHLSLWSNKPIEEVIDAARLAAILTPGCAQGRPLRLLGGHGVDTKFFERNGALLTRLLDERFDGAASEQGLVNFLGALEEGDHWVLLAPLAQDQLPFKRMKVTTAELAQVALPCARILVIENEQCLHLLPSLPDTIAILGAGLDLQWLDSPALADKQVGYWGDMDTWGLLMLARARQYRPDLTPLLMSQTLFESYAKQSAVNEPVVAQPAPPSGLDNIEAAFYRYLIGCKRGRLEQEFLPREEVETALVEWSRG